MSKTSSVRMALWTILLAASPFLSTAVNVDYGLEMFFKAAKGSCWLDKLHKLPTVKENDPMKLWGSCDANMKYEVKENVYEKKYKAVFDFQHPPLTDPVNIKKMENHAMEQVKDIFKFKLTVLDSQYQTRCRKFVDNENQSPAKDFSSLLGDSSRGSYAFKGLAHCILEVAEQRNGKQEMAALKSRWTSPKSFHQAIIDRENENRARHNTPPLTLDSELNTRAQRWADKLAAAGYCRSEHIKDVEPNNPDIKYQGEETGESIHGSGYKAGEDVDIALESANGWYTEVQNYPWPAFNGYNADFYKIGHFTQSVWKSSRLAGYGIGRSPGCDSAFVVARYFPGGNQREYGNDEWAKFRDNVLPKNY